jgi:hypothetical protein
MLRSAYLTLVALILVLVPRAVPNITPEEHVASREKHRGEATSRARAYSSHYQAPAFLPGALGETPVWRNVSVMYVSTTGSAITAPESMLLAWSRPASHAGAPVRVQVQVGGCVR